jgi:hypothetical protein
MYPHSPSRPTSCGVCGHVGAYPVQLTLLLLTRFHKFFSTYVLHSLHLYLRSWRHLQSACTQKTPDAFTRHNRKDIPCHANNRSPLSHFQIPFHPALHDFSSIPDLLSFQSCAVRVLLQNHPACNTFSSFRHSVNLVSGGGGVPSPQERLSKSLLPKFFCCHFSRSAGRTWNRTNLSTVTR